MQRSVTKEIVVMAMTRMANGICVAGIEPETGKWVRPVRLDVSDPMERCIQLTDFIIKGKPQLANLSPTQFWLIEPRPDPPHIEDWLLDRGHKPHLLREFTDKEKLDFLKANEDKTSIERLLSRKCSLGLINPDDFSIHFCPNKAGTDISIRISFSLKGLAYEDKSCPDLKMRALGRKLLLYFKKTEYRLSKREFQRKGYKNCFFVLGLTRLYKGENWLMVVGVHSIPEYKAEIDFTQL